MSRNNYGQLEGVSGIISTSGTSFVMKEIISWSPAYDARTMDVTGFGDSGGDGTLTKCNRSHLVVNNGGRGFVTGKISDSKLFNLASLGDANLTTTTGRGNLVFNMGNSRKITQAVIMTNITITREEKGDVYIRFQYISDGSPVEASV